MHATIIGIDIGTEHLTAVQTGGGLKGRRILACHRIPLNGEGLEGALQTLASEMDLSGQTCRVAIPDGLVSFRNVKMPFGDVKKIRKALPFEVEGLVPYSVDELLIDFVTAGDRTAEGILTASVRKKDLSHCLDLLRSNGIDPEVLGVRGSALASWVMDQSGTPDHALVLEAGRNRHTLIVCRKKRVALIRSFVSDRGLWELSVGADAGACDPTGPSVGTIEPFFRSLCARIHHTVHAFMVNEGVADQPEKLFFTGETLQATTAAAILSRYLEMPAEPIDVGRDKRFRMDEGVTGDWSPSLMNGALSLTLLNPSRWGGFNFRKDEFSKEKRYLRIRQAAPRAAIFLFLILCLLAADGIIDTGYLKREYQFLDREMVTLFRQTLPQVTRVVDPVQQLKVSVEEMKRSALARPAGSPEHTVLDVLKEISARIPPAIHLQIYRMVADPETVRLSGRTDAFHEVDKIKNELSASAMFGPVAITSANLDRTGKKIQFEISIERNR